MSRPFGYTWPLLTADQVRARILKRFTPQPDTGCWLWNRSCTPDGYGQLSLRGWSHLAHRVAYQVLVGPIPDGLTLDHLCRVRSCVNPAHLEPVTIAENVMRGVGPCAQHARKTHCKHGHPYSGDNLAWKGNGRHRLCLQCQRRHYVERLAGKRAATRKRRTEPGNAGIPYPPDTTITEAP